MGGLHLLNLLLLQLEVQEAAHKLCYHPHISHNNILKISMKEVLHLHILFQIKVFLLMVQLMVVEHSSLLGVKEEILHVHTLFQYKMFLG